MSTVLIFATTSVGLPVQTASVTNPNITRNSMRISQNDPKDYMDEEKAIITLKTLKTIFEENGIDYWLDYGTLLGAFREGRFIPWDTDIELYFKYYNPKKYWTAIDSLIKKGFIVEPKSGEILDVRGNGYVGCSIGFFQLNTRDFFYSWFFSILPKSFRMFIIRFMQKRYFSSKSETIRPDNGNIRDKTWHCWKIRSFLPTFFASYLVQVKMYDFSVSVPLFADELLYLRYGKDWKTPKKKYESYTT